MGFLFCKKEVEKEKDCHYMSNDNGIVVELDLVETRMFYDTTWRVLVTRNGNEVAKATIVRRDTETFKNLDKSIRELSVISAETVKALDESGKIYYD